MRKGLRRILLILPAVVLALIAAGIFTNAYQIFLPCFERGEEVQPQYGDLILVLGGGMRRGLELGYSTRERLELALRFYRERSRRILVTDGSLYPGSRAIRVFRDFLLKNGVRSGDILLEGKSQTTYENFLYTLPLVQKHSREGVIICTSPYHQKRVRIILRNLQPGYSYVIARMEESEIYQAGSVRRRIRNLGLMIRETGALIKYRLFPSPAVGTDGTE